MTGALVVKGFNEISYDELMDVNGGLTLTGESHYNGITDWGASVTVTGSKGYLTIGASSEKGIIFKFHYDSNGYYPSSSSY